jgi:hypothetical protein
MGSAFYRVHPVRGQSATSGGLPAPATCGGCSRLQASDGAPPDHPRIWQVAVRSCHPSRIAAVPLLCAAIVAGVRLAATMLPTTCCAFLRRPIRRSNGTARFRGSEQGAWLRPIRRDQALPAADAFRSHAPLRTVRHDAARLASTSGLKASVSDPGRVLGACLSNRKSPSRGE